mmetsp:Transcript_29126/g.66039  ORF Transcript_29126/g.66039 Transcript_29126/m.66039 type:complete len:773 (-) Transcript_29126:130-2448(-)
MQGKERRVKGTTNMSARAAEGKTSIPKTEFYRSWTHKLISPDVYQPPEVHKDHDHVYKHTATWRPVDVYERDFVTTQTSSFGNPANQPVYKDQSVKTSEQLAAEKAVRNKQMRAVDALTKVAKVHYGTTSSMLKAFNKKNSDDISVSELGAYMKRHKIDQFVSGEERQLIFDSVDAQHEGSVGVADLLRRAEEQEFKDAEHSSSMAEVRDFLLNHVEEIRSKRADDSGPADNELRQRKNEKAMKGEKDMIKKAIGQKTFDIDVDHEELHEAIEHLFSKPHTSQQHNKFARFLRHANLNLSTVQFYDMRSEELEGLKLRAAVIDQRYNDHEVIGRYTDLEKTRSLPSLATTNAMVSDADLATLAHKNHIMQAALEAREVADEYVEYSEIQAQYEEHGHIQSHNHYHSPQGSPAQKQGGLSASRSLSSLPISARPSPLAAPPSLASSASQTSIDMSALGSGGGAGRNRDLAPLALKQNQNQRGSPGAGGPGLGASGRSHRNLLEGTAGVDADDTSMSHMNSTGPRERRQEEGVFADQGQRRTQDSDFYTQVFAEGQSLGKLKDPCKVMRLEKAAELYQQPLGRRAVARGPTDWSRIGVGGDRQAGDVGYGSDEDDRFKTTNGKFYPPLLYEPSKPVSRDLVSESELNFRKKQFRWNERAARMKANVDVTTNRLEFEAVEREVRGLRRDHSRVEDRIRYQTAMFLNDLKCYKSKPLVRMAKKQNIHLSDRMWNGTNTMGQEEGEMRDFKSVYTASFDSSILALSDTLSAKPPTSW